MGTSSSGKGPKPTTPILPNWIPKEPHLPLPQKDDKPEDDEPENNPDSSIEDNHDSENIDDVSPNRFMEARRNFNSFSQNRTTNLSALRNSLKSYVRKASGGSSTFARRMLPSISRVVAFHTAVNTFKEQGITEALKSFNLSDYANKPVLEILSALTDAIFNNNGPYNDIQDDSITKFAYANTINRIVETENINLDALTDENIEVMTAIFIEETIATKVICDIGVKLFEKVQDCKEIIAVEEAVYQIVSGLVRTQIMPEIIATQKEASENIEKNIMNIYRIAFDCIVGTIQ